MPRSDESGRRNRYKEKSYKSRDRSSSRERRDYKEKRRYKEVSRKKSYERSPSYRSTSHKSSSSSRHRSRSTQKKSSRRSSSRSSTTSSSSSSSKKSRQRSSSSPELPKVAEYTGPKTINLEPANEEIKRLIIDEIEDDSFAPKSFTSAAKKTSDKVIIDLQRETISMPKVEKIEPSEDHIIHTKFLGDSEQRLEKWVKKLFNYRQKYVNE